MQNNDKSKGNARLTKEWILENTKKYPQDKPTENANDGIDIERRWLNLLLAGRIENNRKYMIMLFIATPTEMKRIELKKNIHEARYFINIIRQKDFGIWKYVEEING